MTYEKKLETMKAEAFRIARSYDLPYTRKMSDKELTEKIDGMSYAFLASFIEYHNESCVARKFYKEV